MLTLETAKGMEAQLESKYLFDLHENRLHASIFAETLDGASGFSGT